MKTPRSARVRGWRWRRNPLRRPSDLVEAWLLVAAWTIALMSGLVVGLLTAGAVAHTAASVQQRPAGHAATAPAHGTAAAGNTAADPGSGFGTGRPDSGRPPAGRAVGTEVVVATMAAVATGGVVWAGTRAVRRRIDARRMEQWSAEWERYDAHRGPRTG